MAQTAQAGKINHKHSTEFRWLTGEAAQRLSVVMVVTDVLGVTVGQVL